MSQMEFVDQVKINFPLLADSVRASQMSAYMRNTFLFFGIPSPIRKASVKLALEHCGFPDNVIDVANALWNLHEREYQLTAVELLTTAVSRKKNPLLYDRATITAGENLITTKSWWDTVDRLAPRVAGKLLISTDKLTRTANTWIGSDNIWLQRSAIIAQLHNKQKTNSDLLFSLILKRSESKEFFIRKGAGWALREYSKSNPVAVRDFIELYRDRLSPLTIREGGKYC